MSLRFVNAVPFGSFQFLHAAQICLTMAFLQIAGTTSFSCKKSGLVSVWECTIYIYLCVFCLYQKKLQQPPQSFTCQAPAWRKSWTPGVSLCQPSNGARMRRKRDVGASLRRCPRDQAAESCGFFFMGILAGPPPKATPPKK